LHGDLLRYQLGGCRGSSFSGRIEGVHYIGGDAGLGALHAGAGGGGGQGGSGGTFVCRHQRRRRCGSRLQLLLRLDLLRRLLLLRLLLLYNGGLGCGRGLDDDLGGALGVVAQSVVSWVWGWGF